MEAMSFMLLAPPPCLVRAWCKQPRAAPAGGLVGGGLAWAGVCVATPRARTLGSSSRSRAEKMVSAASHLPETVEIAAAHPARPNRRRQHFRARGPKGQVPERPEPRCHGGGRAWRGQALVITGKRTVHGSKECRCTRLDCSSAHKPRFRVQPYHRRVGSKPSTAPRGPGRRGALRM